MQIGFGGVRGSCPVAHHDFLAYGGDTTSLLVEGAAGERVLLDAGTGLRNLAPRCAGEAPLLLLMTHVHLDHVIGLPTFAPLHQPGRAFEIAAPVREGVAVAEAIGQLLGKPFWPVALAQVGAAVRCHVLPDDSWPAPWQHGGLEIRWCPVHHRHGCHAYRIDEPASGAALVFATDLEWSLSTAQEQDALLRLCREPSPCGLLIMDGQFCQANQAAFRHWGHSTWEDAVAVAQAGGAARLVVTHHAPASTDLYLANVDSDLGSTLPGASLARQGLTIKLGANR